MTVRVERVRAGLIAGSLLLLVGLAGTFGYARYRAGKSWLNKLKQRSGASLVRETNGFTYSQSLKGKTVFTLHAAKAFQHTDGHWVLHDVVLTLYGLREENRSDRIYGSDFEWDENQGIARADGEVEMDLQVPSGVVAAQRRGSPATGNADAMSNSIHVRTRGLVFLRSLGVAATQEQIEFRYGGLTCVAKGAEFNSSPSSLHLLADVQMNGQMKGKPMSLTAARGDFDRSSNVASFVQPVLVSEGNRARAQNAVLFLRKDGSVERAEASGDVMLDEGTRHLGAPRLEAGLNEKNQPQTARMVGGVRMVDENASRPVRAEAAEMRMRFDALGRPADVTAVGKASMVAREDGGNGVWLEREMHGEQIVAAFHEVGKKSVVQQIRATGGAEMRGDSLAKTVAAPRAGKQAGQIAEAKAGVRPGIQSGIQTTGVAADDLLVKFAAGENGAARPESLHGQGHTVLRQTGPLAEEQVSSSDLLDLVFSGEGAGTKATKNSVASATQIGHVSIVNRAAMKPGAKGKTQDVSTASAERAAYDGPTNMLSLLGGVHLADSGTSLTADAVAFDQQSGDAEAHGNVAVTLAGGAAGTGSAGTGAKAAGGGGVNASGSDATHVAAQQAFLHKASQVAEFSGTAAKPARLWQNTSQVNAGNIVIDRQKNTLVARPLVAGGTVESVFVGAAAKMGIGGGGVAPVDGSAPVDGAAAGRTVSARMTPGGTGAATILRVESRLVEYSDGLRQAVFEGPVRIDGSVGEVRGQRTIVYFAPAVRGAGTLKAGGGGAGGGGMMMGGTLDRVVVSGDVRVEQPGRHGSGDQLTYKAADGSFVLTGTPAVPSRMVDAVQGSVTGASLLFRAGDSTIVVAGAPAAVGQRPQRARIDTRVRQKPE